MFKSQNIHNLYFCCSRCNSLTFMLDYEDVKRFKSKLFTKLTTDRPWPTPWPTPWLRPWPVPHVLSLPKMHGEYCYCRLLVSTFY